MRSQNFSRSKQSYQKLIKSLTLIFCFLVIPGFLCLLAWISPAAAQTPKHFDELTFEPLPEIEIPDFQRTTLANGMTVYLMEDHDLPLVGGQSWIKTGSRLEPAEKVGLASITGEVVRTGGTQNHPADELNELLEQRAAAVEVSIGGSSGRASFSSLTEDLDTVLDLYAEVLTQPQLPQDKIDLAKKQRVGAIARRNDDPDDVGRREFQRLVYGNESPYARISEYDSINSISQKDVQDFYQRYFQPDRMILGIFGDFDSATMLDKLNERFGEWVPTSSDQDQLPEVVPVDAGGTFLVDQPQLTQSSIQIGHIGGRLDDPDIFSMNVLNQVLNSFGGRLFNEVRTRQGLAYSVYGVWSPRYDYPGIFIAGGQTRSEETVPFIKAVKQEIEKVREAPVSEEELARAKDSILNSFVFNFDQPGKTLGRLMRYEYFGYPEDYIFEYQRGVKAATAQDLLRAAQDNLQPEKLITLVVGNQSQIQPDLSTLDQSSVQMLDITIPEASSAS